MDEELAITKTERGEWTPEQFMYIQWNALPPRDRWPPSAQEVAQGLKVAPRTLRRWKTLPGFMEAVYEEVRKFAGDRLAGVMKALCDKAESGDVSAIKLYFEVTGLYQPGQEIVFAPGRYGADEFKEGAIYVQQWFEARFGTRTRRTIVIEGERSGEGEV